MSIELVKFFFGASMNVSQKCQYALRAMFELAKRQGPGVTTIADVADAQAIPARFLEVILAELKHGGFVESRRGVRGGYALVRDPRGIAVGEIIRFIDGPISPVRCVDGSAEAECPLYGRCAFLGLWRRAGAALAGVYDNTTLRDLIEEEQAAQVGQNPVYCI
jgi:Rrf2 family cysteine metabolism transcriptional repressor